MQDNSFNNVNFWSQHGDDPVVHESAFQLAHRLNKKPWICDRCGACFPSKSYHKCKDGQPSVWHRRRIFALSLSDWLWDRIPVPVLARVFDTMRVCDEVDWLLCTKRPEAWRVRMLKVLDSKGHEDWRLWQFVYNWFEGKAPKHIRIGTTVENQAMADKRVPELLKIPAAVRFLSIEPLLEHIDLVKCGAVWAGIDWVIVGGESGSLARPCNISWIRSIKDQCAVAKVPCFVKQMGSWPIILKHPKGGDPAEWHEDLRVRQWPEARR